MGKEEFIRLAIIEFINSPNFALGMLDDFIEAMSRAWDAVYK